MVEKENSTVTVEVVRTVFVEIKRELETITELETAVEIETAMEISVAALMISVVCYMFLFICLMFLYSTFFVVLLAIKLLLSCLLSPAYICSFYSAACCFSFFLF